MEVVHAKRQKTNLFVGMCEGLAIQRGVILFRSLKYKHFFPILFCFNPIN